MIPIIYNPELETEVIKTMIYLHEPDNDSLIEAMERLDEDCFTGEQRKSLFRLMKKLHNQGKSISDGNLNSSMDVDQLNYLLSLSVRWPTSNNTLTIWINDLIKIATTRKVYNLAWSSARQLSENHKDTDYCQNLINSIPEQLTKIQEGSDKGHYGVYNAQECVERYKTMLTQGGNLISSGFEDLDALLEGGFEKGTTITIGGPSSAGKTHFALKMALEISERQREKNAIIFSLEMAEARTITRLLTHLIEKPDKGPSKFNEQEAEQALDYFSRTNINICDKRNVNLAYIRAACRRAHTEKGLSVVVIDHLDRVQKHVNNKLRSDEILTDIAIGLSDIAKEFDCNIIILTQLNKEAIKRPDKRPTMNDSKNSNATAEVSDYWFGIKRIGQWDLERKFSDSNLFELLLDKCRNGEQGIVYFNLKYNCVYENISQEFARRLVENAKIERKQFANETTVKESVKRFGTYEDY